MALALIAPAAAPAVAGATDPGEEQEREYEGGTEVGPGAPEPEELTPGQGSTNDVVDENSPPLLAPGDNSDPNEGENENGPVENEAQVPQHETEGEPPIQPPATAPAPPPTTPTPPAAQPIPAPAPVKPTPAPRSRVAPTRRDAKPAPPVKTRPRARRPAPAQTRATARARPAPAAKAGPTQSVLRAAAVPTAAAPAPQKAGLPTYTVRAGDTLWSIAAAQLGGGATAAQIAREVQRIWDGNARAIGTGDPSLLGVGVTLRLR